MTKAYNTPEDFVADESFIRYCSHQNEKDVQFWENWISEHPDQQTNVDQAVHLIESLAVRPTYRSKVKEWEKLKKLSGQPTDLPVGKGSGDRVRRIWWTAAAVVTFLVITGLGIRLWSNMENPQLAYETGSGESKELVLPDQTKVWLNADSKLICASNFKQSDKRIVTLEGEAFFDVQKDAGRPFIIHTKALNIEVLGTSFNVRAYPRSTTTSTTLISGAIQVSLTAQPEKTFHLQPKEKFTIVNNKPNEVKNENTSSKAGQRLPEVRSLKPMIQVSQVRQDPLLENDEILETAWMDGKLAFRNENFEELALQLSHRYGVQFHFEMETLKRYQFTGIFTTETLPEALHALQLTSPSHPFSYRIEGRDVYILDTNNQHKVKTIKK